MRESDSESTSEHLVILSFSMVLVSAICWRRCDLARISCENIYWYLDNAVSPQRNLIVVGGAWSSLLHQLVSETIDVMVTKISIRGLHRLIDPVPTLIRVNSDPKEEPSIMGSKVCCTAKVIIGMKMQSILKSAILL